MHSFLYLWNQFIQIHLNQDSPTIPPWNCMRTHPVVNPYCSSEIRWEFWNSFFLFFFNLPISLKTGLFFFPLWLHMKKNISGYFPKVFWHPHPNWDISKFVVFSQLENCLNPLNIDIWLMTWASSWWPVSSWPWRVAPVR